jgi:uncharacterized protein
MFGKKRPSPQQAIQGRFEIERNGRVAYLDYTLTDKVLQLLHTEVPEPLRGEGLTSELAQSALDWAREHGVKVDVICESVAAYVSKHPEYKDLILK